MKISSKQRAALQFVADNQGSDERRGVRTGNTIDRHSMEWLDKDGVGCLIGCLTFYSLRTKGLIHWVTPAGFIANYRLTKLGTMVIAMVPKVRAGNAIVATHLREEAVLLDMMSERQRCEFPDSNDHEVTRRAAERIRELADNMDNAST